MDITGLADPWTSARSLHDLAEATVDLLEGRLQETPSHSGPPDSESAGLITDLVSMNRGGFVTTDSQPGLFDTSTRSGQRAYVMGFCGEEVVAKIEAGLLFNELVAVTFAPTVNAFSSIPVTIEGNEPFTFLGRWSRDELDFYRNGDAHLNAALDSAWGVQIFDPVWGRNDRLRGAVLLALNT